MAAELRTVVSMRPPSWQEIDWRTYQRWVTVRGRPVNVIDTGTGDPLLFIHGLGGCWENWLEQLPVFAHAHRVVAFDLPGFGASPLSAQDVSVPGFVLTVLDLLDALGIGRANVVGNSMGGLIAAELAIDAPERVARLALAAPAGIPFVYRPRQLPKVLVLFPLVAGVAAWVGANADSAAHRPRARRLLMRFVADHPEELSAPLAAEQLRGVGKPGFRLALEALADYSIRERLSGISCPTLIVWGEHDHVLPVRHADVYARAIEHARKVILRETGHVPMFERPAEFNALLAELLDVELAATAAASLEGESSAGQRISA
jgi:pimeloyl-ACP methyl ester carboxylesterase